METVERLSLRSVVGKSVTFNAGPLVRTRVDSRLFGRASHFGSLYHYMAHVFETIVSVSLMDHVAKVTNENISAHLLGLNADGIAHVDSSSVCCLVVYTYYFIHF